MKQTTTYAPILPVFALCSDSFLSNLFLTLTDNLYTVNDRRVQREYTLDTAAMCNTANSKGFADTAVLLCDYGAFEYLDTALVAFLDSYVYLYSITYCKCRYFLLASLIVFNASILISS